MLRTTFLALLIALVSASGAVGPVRAAPPVPKVVLIVGPVGSVTESYRRLANQAAAAAAAEGAQVVKVYSPDATWPAVKRATSGASIIVYLGHGNGWPSRYRDELYPPSQNGFGLNPVAGGDNSSHQYFGEAAVGRLKFADNAVVVFSHLCYASGNTEPGLPEGSRSDAIQRVDNYAAGFIRAGAGAVIAEAALGPAYYVRALLRDRRSVESIWNSAPTASGRHAIAAASRRTPGFGLHLDPRRGDGGYTRSLVSRGVTAAQVRASARGNASGGQATGLTLAPPVTPSLASAGVRFAEPVLKSLPVAGTRTRVNFPLATGRTTRIPAGARISLRWDLIKADAPPAPAPSGEPDASVADPLAAGPAASATPVPAAPEVDLVVPEQPATVIEPLRAKRGPRVIGVEVAYPGIPGLYRLTAILHTAEGVAYDEATQAMLTPVIVHIGGANAAAYGAPATLSLEAGAPVNVPVAVMNAGSAKWNAIVAPVTPEPGTIEIAASPEPSLGPSPEAAAAANPEAAVATSPEPTEPSLGSAIVLPKLIATWVSADGLPVPAALNLALPGEAWAPGGTAELLLGLVAPDQPGTYLLLLDVLTPELGAMSSLGSEPAMIRVTVNGAATPAPLPAGSPAPALPEPETPTPSLSPDVLPTPAIRTPPPDDLS